MRQRLTAAKIKSAPPGKYFDGGGLIFFKRDDGGAQWILRTTVHGRRREMGLGGYPDISLSDARETAQKFRTMAKKGVDPIKARQKERRDILTLADATTACFEARKAELKGDGKAGRWLSPLETHVLPKLGRVPCVELDQQDIKNTLAPIWHKKADTARKALNRIGIVLQYAAASGLNVDLQATAKARALLGKQRHTPKNIPAMPWQDVPGFYQTLAADDTPVNLALRLLILTGARSGPVRNAHVDQFTEDNWTIPEGLMKAGGEFKIPLSDEAQHVIALAKRTSRDGWLFPGVRKGVISDMSMTAVMKRQELAARPHGFRSSLREWMDQQSVRFEVAETVLAHQVGSSVSRAYLRTDWLEERRAIMQSWSDFLTTGASAKISEGRRLFEATIQP